MTPWQKEICRKILTEETANKEIRTNLKKYSRQEKVGAFYFILMFNAEYHEDTGKNYWHASVTVRKGNKFLMPIEFNKAVSKKVMRLFDSALNGVGIQEKEYSMITVDKGICAWHRWREFTEEDEKERSKL